jgi:tetratricopeptide (TPR) repeat protein
VEKALPTTFRRMGSLCLLALCAGILLFAAGAYGEESPNLYEQIKQHVKQLEYSEGTAQDFIQMVQGWKDKQGRCALTGWSEKLSEAKKDCEQNKISRNHLAEIEGNIAEELGQRIKREIRFNENFFELGDIVEQRQTQCLGYTQLFYVLGNSIGLEVKPINVEQMRTGKLPTASAHIAGIAELSNGQSIIVDLVPNGFVSIPFRLEEQFEKAGEYWQLRDKSNPLELDRKIQILGEKELVAYIYNNRANVYIKRGQFAEAVGELDKAIEYHPKYAEAYYNRGIAQRHLERLNQAVSDYTRAIEFNPDFAEAYANRGIIYSRLGQLNEAIADYTKAIGINPDFGNAYYNRGIAYNKLGQAAAAIADYERTIKLDAGLAAKAYGNRGVSYAMLGRVEEARKDLLKAAELNSEMKEYAKAAIERFKLNTNLN